MEQGQLAVVPFKIPFGARQIGLTFRRDWRPTATQALLIDQIRGRRPPRYRKNQWRRPGFRLLPEGVRILEGNGFSLDGKK